MSLTQGDEVSVQDLLEQVPVTGSKVALKYDEDGALDVKDAVSKHSVYVGDKKVESASEKLTLPLGPKHKSVTVTIDGESFHVSLQKLGDGLPAEERHDLEEAMNSEREDATAVERASVKKANARKNGKNK